MRRVVIEGDRKWGGARAGSHRLRARPARVGNNASTPPTMSCRRWVRPSRAKTSSSTPSPLPGRPQWSSGFSLRRDWPCGLDRPVAYALTPTRTVDRTLEHHRRSQWELRPVAVATVNGTPDSTPIRTGVTTVTVDNPLPSVHQLPDQWSRVERQRISVRQCALSWRNRVVPLDRGERDHLPRRKLGPRKWWALLVQAPVGLHERPQRLLHLGGRSRILGWFVQRHQRRDNGAQHVSVVTGLAQR